MPDRAQVTSTQPLVTMVVVGIVGVVGSMALWTLRPITTADIALAVFGAIIATWAVVVWSRPQEVSASD